MESDWPTPNEWYNEPDQNTGVGLGGGESNENPRKHAPHQKDNDDPGNHSHEEQISGIAGVTATTR